MFDVYRKELEVAGKKLVIETGKIARQADGAVMVSIDDTSVLVTATAAREMREGQDFFPLTVNYQEKAFAAGKIPGGFFKREGRPSENETLVCRLIDRPIRPLFADGFLNETQIIATVMSHDMDNNPDIAALIGTSAALTLSGLPFMGPIAASRVGYINGEFILNPTYEELENSELDLIVAGTQEGVLMVESEAHELSEEIMLEAVQFGWKGFQPVIDAIIQLAEQCAKEPWDLPEKDKAAEKLLKDLDKKFGKDVAKAYEIKEKLERQNALSELKAKAVESFEDEDKGLTSTKIKSVFKTLESNVVRGEILKSGNRIDGRDTKTVRPIACEVGVIPRTHGSALFTRGETQALVVTTLGTGQDEQIIDSLTGEYRERFLLHYNFPPYSVGECGRVGSPGRREVGHGKLAWRAIHPLLPSAEDFPYTIRSVTEVTESNGSSSMATVCGTSLSMMDAGVPLKRPVAGIAMGLIKEDKDYAVLSDILGDEDHLGDMDFKVAGSSEGITSLQMDIKITSITEDIMKIALKQAKDGRTHILEQMEKAISSSRDDVNEYAPKIVSLTIPTDKIRDVIGTGGKIIREIIDTTGTKVDIEDDGTVRIAGSDQEAIDKAIKMVKDLTDEPELHKVYDGKVVKTVDFGAFVNFLGAKDGLVHISEIADEHVKNVTDYIKEGDMVKVMIIGFDDRGKVKLSMRRVDQETGEPREQQDKQAAG